MVTRRRSTGLLAGLASIGEGLASIGEGLASLFGASPRRRRRPRTYEEIVGRSALLRTIGPDSEDWDAVGRDLRAAFDEVRASMTPEQRRAVEETP